MNKIALQPPWQALSRFGSCYLRLQLNLVGFLLLPSELVEPFRRLLLVDHYSIVYLLFPSSFVKLCGFFAERSLSCICSLFILYPLPARCLVWRSCVELLSYKANVLGKAKRLYRAGFHVCCGISDILFAKVVQINLVLVVIFILRCRNSFCRIKRIYCLIFCLVLPKIINF